MPALRTTHRHPPGSAACRAVALALAVLGTLTAPGCVSDKPEGPDMETLQAINSYPLLATSQQAGVAPPPPAVAQTPARPVPAGPALPALAPPAPVTPAPASPAAVGPALVGPPPALVSPSPAPAVTQAWMEEQLQKFDDRYAQAAAEIKAVFEQSTGLLNHTVTLADLQPIPAGIHKLSNDLAAFAGRTEGTLSTIQARLDRLEHAQATASAPPASGAAPGTPETPVSATNPDLAGFLEALKALQATPRQTLPIRSWLEAHPDNGEAPEALLQLGMSLFDRYPAASQFYFRRLIVKYPHSSQAAEARALVTDHRVPQRSAAPAAERAAPASAPAPAATPEAKTSAKPEASPLAPPATRTPPTLNLEPKAPVSEPKKDLKTSGAGFLPRSPLLPNQTGPTPAGIAELK